MPPRFDKAPRKKKVVRRKPPAGPRDATFHTPKRTPPPRSEAAAGAGYGAAPKPARAPARKVVRRPSPRSEVAAAGGVDTKRAAAFTRTPEYKRALHAARLAERERLAAAYTHRAPARTVAPPVVHEDGQRYEKVTRSIGGLGGLAGVTRTTYRPLGRTNEITPTRYSGLYKRGAVDDAIFKATAPFFRDYRDLTIGTVPMVAHEVGNVASGHPERVVEDVARPYGELFSHPIKSFKEHPLASVVMLAGAKGAVGRGAGAAARTGAFGRRAKRAATTERSAAAVEGTLLSEPRRYSPDVITKAAQVGVEKAGGRRVRRLTRKADKLEAQGRGAQADVVREQAARSAPERMSEQQAGRRTDELVDVNEVVRRRHAGDVDVATHQALRNVEAGAKRKVRRGQQTKPTAAVSLVAQNITAATREDLAAFRRELEHQHEHGDLTNVQKAQNRDLREQITKALEVEHDMGKVAGAAQRYQAIVHGLTQKLVDYKMLDPEVAARRPELPFAVRTLKAQRDTTPRLTAAGVEKFVAKEERKLTEKRVRKVRRKETQAQTALRQAVADARVSAARQKSSPELAAARGDARAAQAHLARLQRTETSAARKAGRAEGRATYTAAQADRALFRGDEEYLKRANRAKRANIEKSKAAKAVRNAERNPSLYTAAERAKAHARHEKAIVASRTAHEAMQERITEIRSAAADAVTAVARTPRGAAVSSEQALASDLGRRPVGDLGRVESSRAAEQVIGGEKVLARKRVRRAEQRVTSEKGRIRGVAPQQADAVRRALGGYEDARAARIRAQEEATQAKARHVEAKKAGKGQADKQAPGFVDPAGRTLTTEQIAAERRATPGMVGEPAYVSHAANLTRPGSFYRESSRPVKVEDRAFSGEAQTKGIIDASPEALHANTRKLQTLADAHEGWMRYLTEAGLRRGEGELLTGTRAEVEKAIGETRFDKNGRPIPGAYQWRVVRLNPWGGRREQLNDLIERVNDLPDHQEGHPLIESLQEALQGKGDGEFAAIPEAVAHRIDQHLRVLGSTPGKVWNSLISLWRKNVLSTSPKWAAGNVIEAFVRGAIYGVRPGDRAKFNRVLDELAKTDPKAAERLRAQLGEGHYGFTERHQRHTTAQELADPTRHNRATVEIARLLGAANRTPVVNWLPRAFRSWTGFVFRDMARVETQFRFAMAGRHLRATFDDVGLGRLSEQAARDAAEGLRETKAQIEMARAVRRAYGQYEAFSPGMRRFIGLYTPFIAWSWNAIRFLGSVLPKDHPVLLGLLAAANQSSEDWLREQGQRADRLDALPPWLLGSIITKKGAYRVGRYTPFGLASDPLGSAAGLVMPAFSDTLLAARGLDPFGQPLKESKARALAESILGFIPFAPPVIGAGRRGGTVGEKLTAQFSPLEPTPPDRVEYARVKATLDRIDTRLNKMRRDSEDKLPNGRENPEYRRLLNLKSDTSQRRNELLSQAGIKPDPTLPVERQLIPLRRREKALVDSGKGVDQYGFATKELQTIRDHIAELEDQKRRLAPPKRARKIKPRPKTSVQQQEDRIQRQLDRLRHPGTQEQERLNRQLERLKVESGG